MIELGPVNFHIVARNDTEQRIAQYHVRTARLLLGQLKAVAGNVGLQSRKVRTEDGTEITVMRNMNPYTGQAVCSASIRVRARAGERIVDARASGPFLWIGLRDRRAIGADERLLFIPFMTIWEPGAPDATRQFGERTVGGQILSPRATFQTEPTPELSMGFIPGDELVRAEEAPVYYDTCENAGPDTGPQPASAIGFDPWRSIGQDNGGSASWVVTRSGLCGRTGGYDPTVDVDSEGWADWVQSFELDPGQGGWAQSEGDPEAAAEHSRAIGALGWPRRYDGADGELTDEDRARLVGVPLPGGYLLKLGIFGRNYKPGQPRDFETQPKGGTLPMPSTYDSDSCGSIPVQLKIVSGRGDLFKVQTFDIELTVPNALPEYRVHRTMPGHFDGARIGSALGNNDNEAQPYDAWFSGSGPVDFGAGACETLWSAQDTGSAPAVDDALSQYAFSTFVVDPWMGAVRRDDIQPWGIG